MPFEGLSHLPPHLCMQLVDSALVNSAQVVQATQLAPAEQVPTSPLYARTSTGQHAHAGSTVTATHVQGAMRPPTGKGIANIPTPLPPPIFSQHKLVTPLRPLVIERELASHPDKGFVSQLLANITIGCNIGYQGPQFPYTAQHLPTAYTHTHIITESLAKECAAGRMAGPYSHPPLPNLRCSGLGVVPKKDGGWRVIYHLSAPPGKSINDFIDPARFSLHYCSIDAAIKMVNILGQNALMGKIDLKNAFRQIPVRKEDWHLLGIHWQGKWFVDKCLPFGLRSSPALFDQLATAIEWILHNKCKINHIIHYLDDFFTAGTPESNTCKRNMQAMNALCHRIGSPTKPEKEEGPFTTLTFLGILLNSTTMTASITNSRKEELQQAIATHARQTNLH